MVLDLEVLEHCLDHEQLALGTVIFIYFNLTFEHEIADELNDLNYHNFWGTLGLGDQHSILSLQEFRQNLRFVAVNVVQLREFQKFVCYSKAPAHQGKKLVFDRAISSSLESLRDPFPLVPHLFVVLEQLPIVRRRPFLFAQAWIQLVIVSLSALLRTFVKSHILQF